MTENRPPGSTVCPNCRSQFTSGAAVCPVCGWATGAMQPPGGNPDEMPAPKQGSEGMPLPATPLPGPTPGLSGQVPTSEQPPVFGPPPGYGPPPSYPLSPDYGQPPWYTPPQRYGPQQAAAGYGYAAAPRRPNRRPIFAGLGAIALVAVIAVGALLVHAFGAHAGPTATMVYQLVPDGSRQITDASLNTTVAILQKRLNLYGADGTVQKLPPDRVSVQVFGVGDLAALTSFIGATGQIAFVWLPPDTYGKMGTVGSIEVPAAGAIIDPSLPAQFNGNQIDPNSFNVWADRSNPGRWLIGFAFSSEYVKQFATWTGQHVNDYFAMVLDGKVVETPYIQAPILDGSVQFGGGFTEAQAKDLANILRAGELPFPLREVSRAVTSPAPPR